MRIDWQKCVLNLRSEGLSMATVARKIGRSQAVVQRLARGDSKYVSFEDGVRLLDLHYDLCADKHSELRREGFS